MKRKTLTALIAAALLASPLPGGVLALQVADPQTNAEAQAKHAVVLAQMTACHSPEKTTVTASAEGTVAGKRMTVPLEVIKLSTPGMFAVRREWPSEGVWAVRMVATNPEYKDYATGLVIPVNKDEWSKAGAKQFYHAPTEEDINFALKQANFK